MKTLYDLNWLFGCNFVEYKNKDFLQLEFYNTEINFLEYLNTLKNLSINFDGYTYETYFDGENFVINFNGNDGSLSLTINENGLVDCEVSPISPLMQDEVCQLTTKLASKIEEQDETLVVKANHVWIHNYDYENHKMLEGNKGIAINFYKKVPYTS